jgi:hypothetical protein
MSEQTSPDEPNVYRGPVRRIRLTVSGGTWSVTDHKRVARMTIKRSVRLASDDAEEARKPRGAYFEALDAAGNVVYRRPIEDPTRPSVEIYEGGKIRRVDTPDRELTLDLVVPDVDSVTRLRIVVDGEELPFRQGNKSPRAGGYKIRGGEDG